MKLSPSDRIHIDRELAKRSIADFQEMAWSVLEPSQPYCRGWHTDAISDHLLALTHGDIRRLLINVPPGTSKSTTASVIFPAWLWGPAGLPGKRIIGCAYERTLATRDNRKCRSLIESSWFKDRWSIELESDQNEKTSFENTHKGWRQSYAVRAMTGRRGDVVIWDDPQSPEQAHSDIERETTIRVFKETLPLRINDPAKSVILIIQQRLHEEDISGHILEHDYGYEHLCIPMEYEVPDKKHYTSIGWTDPRKKEGELLDPNRFPREVVERDKKVLGTYGAAGQFQQRPVPRGGGIFRDDWWQFYNEMPDILWRGIYADTAMKPGEENDYSVLQCWGATAKGPLLIDQVRDKWAAPALLRHARAFWDKHLAVKGLGVLRHMKIEDKASGIGLIQSLKEESDIPVIPIPRPRGSNKVQRANDVAPFVEAGRVFIPAKAPWLSDWLHEASTFPNGKHDDQIDPMMDAVLDMVTGPTKAQPSVRRL